MIGGEVVSIEDQILQIFADNKLTINQAKKVINAMTKIVNRVEAKEIRLLVGR